MVIIIPIDISVSLRNLATMFKIIFFVVCLYGIGSSQMVAVTGKVTDGNGSPIAGARVTFVSDANLDSIYETATYTDGTYQVMVPGGTSRLHNAAPSSKTPPAVVFPNPFSQRTALFFTLSAAADVDVAVYSMQGRKIEQLAQGVLPSGAHRFMWQVAATVSPGIYLLYTRIDNIEHVSRVVYTNGGAIASYTHGAPSSHNTAATLVTHKATVIETTYSMYTVADHFYGAFSESVSVTINKVVSVTLQVAESLPFKTVADYLTRKQDDHYAPFFIKGINLGSSTPGRFPSEINVAVSRLQYRRWIARMARAGFNALRVYTLHPPRFYEELYRYNTMHPDEPLYLFQGVWLRYRNSDFFGTDTLPNGLTITTEIDQAIREVIGCVHGRRDIPERGYEAWGTYRTDVTRWTAGYLFGREMDPEEIIHTNTLHPETTAFNGHKLSLVHATPTEVWLAGRLDHILHYEDSMYAVQRPVSVSSWPTLDPLEHPTESGTEDSVSLDFANLDYSNAPGGFFVSFHAYPYFPNFMNTDSLYQLEDDSLGQNSYLGYLKDLKAHYGTVPVMIAEFGVPSSWGNAHYSWYGGMHHGGHPELMQGVHDIRMMRNIYDTGCAGGMVFAWMDEWFKDTWLVHALETGTDDVETSHRIKWHNIVSPEQNFGLVTFDPVEEAPMTEQVVTADSVIAALQLGYDFRYFYVTIALSDTFGPGDTLCLGFDTYRADLGESRLPQGDTVTHRCEFALQIPYGADTASLLVIPSYDMFGYSIRFNFVDTTVQRFRSLATDKGVWNPVRWVNNHVDTSVQAIGRIPMATHQDTALIPLQAVRYDAQSIMVAMPWTLLHFSDPVEMEVIDGFAVAGRLLEVTNGISDGIGVAVAYKGSVTETKHRFTWPSWLYGAIPYIEREKYSLGIISRDLPGIPSTPPLMP